MENCDKCKEGIISAEVSGSRNYFQAIVCDCELGKEIERKVSLGLNPKTSVIIKIDTSDWEGKIDG